MGRFGTAGAFLFFDHLGPMVFPPGIPSAVDMRPRPHVGRSTVTDLFEGGLSPVS